MTTHRVLAGASGRTEGDRRPVPVVHLLTRLLVVATVVAAAGTLAWPDVLRGNAVMNGSARGTAWVLLLGGVPVLLAASRRGPGVSGPTVAVSPLHGLVWTGAVGYVLYNGVMFCFATPFNRLFPAYVAMLGLAVWTLLLLVPALLRAEPPSAPGAPVRAVSGYIGFVVVANALAWLARIAPAVLGEPGDLTAGTGLPVNPVHVQDLAFWLPALAVGAVLLWRRHVAGVLVAGAGLVYWQLEALGVAVDQWLGSHADPTSDVATMGGAWLFVGMFVVGWVPTVALLRRVDASGDPGAR